MRFAPLLLAVLVLSACAASADHRYAGSPGSIYDGVGDPPSAVPASTYDPLAPMAPREFGNGGQVLAPAVPVAR